MDIKQVLLIYFLSLVVYIHLGDKEDMSMNKKIMACFIFRKVNASFLSKMCVYKKLWGDFWIAAVSVFMPMSPCWNNEKKALLGKVDFREQGLAWKVKDVVMQKCGLFLAIFMWQAFLFKINLWMGLIITIS